MDHRGRDDDGVHMFAPLPDGRRFALGHQRLSIIDTSSAGHQPMLSDDGRFGIVLNGEIYNYRELRRDLESSGVVFRTSSDTEVLLRMWERDGVGCLDKLNGMFAFAVWDESEKDLTIVRDRAGIKPVFYSTAGGTFHFASEIKAILAMGVAAELDHESLHQFLTFLWPVPPRTMFKNIYQIEPGHYLKWKNGAVSINEWWDWDLSKKDENLSESDWIDQTLETLDRVVEMEMVADVPVGAFLSGGVDSSAITALMVKHSNDPITAYTTSISADDLHHDIIPDDVQWSRRLASDLSLDYHEIPLQPDNAELLPMLVRQSEAPVIDMAIPSYLISAEARKTRKVMLSGMGGDEIFAGYPRQMAMKLASYGDVIPSAMRRSVYGTLDSMLKGSAGGKIGAVMRNAKKFARSAAFETEDRYLNFGTYFTDTMKSRLYHDDMRVAAGSYDAYAFHRKCFERTRGLDLVDRMLYVDFKTFMPALNLDTTDRTSMAANLEVRVPFLNVEMLNLTAKMPARFKIKGLTRKYILKKATEKILPHEVIWRKKAGFSAPVRSWLRGELRPLVDDLLSAERIRRRGLFDADEVRRIIDLNLSGREDLNLQVFQLLTFEMWMQEFID